MDRSTFFTIVLVLVLVLLAGAVLIGVFDEPFNSWYFEQIHAEPAFELPNENQPIITITINKPSYVTVTTQTINLTNNTPVQMINIGTNKWVVSLQKGQQYELEIATSLFGDRWSEKYRINLNEGNISVDQWSFIFQYGKFIGTISNPE